MTSRFPEENVLQVFETKIRQALHDDDTSGIVVLGYGEVTTVFAIDGEWACKRMPGFSSRADAEVCAGVIRRYVYALGEAGVDVLTTSVHVIEDTARMPVVYCVQPRLDPSSLGPTRMRSAALDAALRDLDRILDAMCAAVSPRLAPDGQLSNWAFVGDRMFYLDVTSPFLRDEAGRDVLDWDQYLHSLPSPLRPIAKRWVVPHLLDKYFTLRGQVVDLLGNLQKERLERLSEPFRNHINDRWKLDPPIAQAEVDAYYASDARTYAMLQGARRLDRWVQRRLLRREYPYFLPPAIDRNV
jgi:hypothetical protein